MGVKVSGFRFQEFALAIADWTGVKKCRNSQLPIGNWQSAIGNGRGFAQS
jgi:hypothetical protein